jgi:hypothetical protein
MRCLALGPSASKKRQGTKSREVWRRQCRGRYDLLGAQHRRQLLWLLEVPDLGRQIVATQRDAEQEPHPGHDAIAVTDARTALDEVELKAAHLVGRGGMRCVCGLSLRAAMSSIIR